MPWEYLLNGAGGAGIGIVFFSLFIKKIIERSVEAQFDIKLEEHRAELNTILENQKSELDIWATVRKDILSEVWSAYKQISCAMASILSVVQEPFAFLSHQQMLQELTNEKARHELSTELRNSTMKYRLLIHEFDLLMPDEANNICQEFFDITFELSEMLLAPAGGDNPLPEDKVREIWSDSIKKLMETKQDNIMTKLLSEEQIQKIFLSQQNEVFRYNTVIIDLKNKRNAFSGYVARYFGLQDVMPWTVRRGCSSE